MMDGGILLGGMWSGSGKTTVTLGLLGALKARGADVRGFKAGPDFIDAGLHSLVTGRPAYNLDPWMCGEAGMRETFARASSGGFAVVEGAMGLFDGVSGGAHLAEALGLPVLLVVDANGMADTAGALVLGFQEYARRRHPGLRWAGVLFNNVGSESHYQRLRASVSDVEVLGYLPRDAEYTLPERHLGLAVAEEGPIGPEGLHALAAAVERHVDLPRLLQLAGRGRAPDGAAPKLPDQDGLVGKRPRIGVARDRAFCFLYKENLDFLEEAGAELVYFSPLAGDPLPFPLDGLYLGGGYPELYAPTLTGNRDLREAIVRFAGEGGAVYAECGGLMYLSRALVDAEGQRHPMCGLLPFETRMRTRRVALGYREVELKADTLLGRKGQRLRGHEFHYSEAVDVPDSLERLYRVRDNRGDTLPEEGYRSGSVLASYIHLHFGSLPEAARAWCRALLSRLAAR